MELDRTFAVGIVAATVAFIALMTCIGFGMQNSNQHYYAAVDRCTAGGGTWMPIHGSGTGLRFLPATN